MYDNGNGILQMDLKIYTYDKYDMVDIAALKVGDTKNWYEIGETAIHVSDDFRGTDHSDLDMGEVAIRSEDFLTGAVTNYDFTPYNTTVRVENGQIVEMNRRFIP